MQRSPVAQFRKSLLILAAGAFAVAAHAADVATKPEAEAMVKKAAAYLEANGKEKAYAEINRKDGPFTDRDLYIVAYGYDGMVHAHGANARMIGKDLLEIKDIDGKAFIKERVNMAKLGKPFWQAYKFTNPVSGKIEPKAMYCQPMEDIIVCGGVYLK